MSRVLCGGRIALFALLTVSFAFGQADLPGSKDYPGISRMPGYRIDEYQELQFDSVTFPVTEGGKDKTQPVEGHVYKFRYDRGKESLASSLQVIRNYQNAARAVGGQILYNAGDGGDRQTVFRIVKGDKEAWAWLHCVGAGGVCNLYIVEKQAMQQEVTVDANAMAGDIAASGRVAVYGIQFDTGKADLKPESEPALAEIAKLLAQNPALKLYVVGHTDMVADLALNLKLSQARAQAVVNALTTQHGIAAARLIPFGNGPYAPVASNKTEEGRARNRRVELVEIATK